MIGLVSKHYYYSRMESPYILERQNPFFIEENNSNKPMIIGGTVIAFLSIILLGITITNQFNL